MTIAARDIGLVRLGSAAAAGTIVQDGYEIDCPWHHHDMHQIQYAFEGAIMLEDRHGSHLLPPGIAGWIPAGVSHRDSIRRVRSTAVLLPRDLVRGGGDRVRLFRATPLMRAMVAEAARWPMNAPADGMADIFFAAFGRLCEEWIAEAAPLHLPASADPALAAATAYVRGDLAEATLTGTCRVAGLSERSLRRRFHAELGLGWEAYRRRARVLRAAELLADTNLPIGRVATDVGFESQGAFARTFRELTGETPRAFRARAGA